jgi:hypothetical protein
MLLIALLDDGHHFGRVMDGLPDCGLFRIEVVDRSQNGGKTRRAAWFDNALDFDTNLAKVLGTLDAGPDLVSLFLIATAFEIDAARQKISLFLGCNFAQRAHLCLNGFEEKMAFSLVYRDRRLRLQFLDDSGQGASFATASLELLEMKIVVRSEQASLSHFRTKRSPVPFLY